MSAPEEIQALLASGRPWDALAPALRLAHEQPSDALARGLAVRAAVAVGLRTPALELAERGATPDDPETAAAIAAARAARDDRFALDARLAIARKNAAALAPLGVDLADALERFAQRERAWEVLATPEGNVIRRPAGSLDPGEWRWAFEQRRAAFEFARRHLSNAGAEPIAPITIEGFAPPWVFVEVARRTPRLGDGYQPRLRVVQRDPLEFLEGASLIDLSSFLAEDRVEWFVGEDAGERWCERVRAAFGCQALGPTIPTGSVRTPIEPAIAERARTLGAEQADVTRRAHARAEAKYAGRDAAHWAARFASGDPVRVLIPTTRYSTFMQHAARDLADAFERLGHRARVLIEPDACSRLAAGAYHDAVDAFEPDLVVVINYPRAERAGVFPAGVPFVCWIQDEMPHLFDPRVGAAQTELDFVAGHLVADLFARCGYDPRRAIGTPVVVSERKFHGAPISGAQRERFACELAFVSHHSETPERLHERKKAEAADPAVAGVLDEIRPRVDAIFGRMGAERVGPLLREAVRGGVRARLGRDPEPGELAQYEIQHAHPYLERLVRHRVLAWADEACRGRGWRLRLFGRGWGKHPTLAHAAGGELDHGDDLRACYQAARAHLHLSAITLVHQRVMECALSGGLPIGVRSLGCLPNLGAPLLAAGLRAEHADRCRLQDRASGFPVADHAELMHHTGMLQRLGQDPGPIAWAAPAMLERLDAHFTFDGAGVFTSPWLLGDPAELTFADAAGLEALVERAIGDDAWRRSRSAFIAARVRQGLTHRALASRLLAFIADRLARSGASVRRAG